MKQSRKKPRPLRPAQPKWSPAALFAQPPADFYRMPDLELRGGRIVTDGCRRVLDFTPEKISLDLGRLVITLYGDALQIESLNGKRLVTAGHVRRIEFSEKWEENNGETGRVES